MRHHALVLSLLALSCGKGDGPAEEKEEVTPGEEGGVNNPQSPVSADRIGVCAPRGIPAPVDVTPSFNALTCLRVSTDKLRDKLGDAGNYPEGSVLLNQHCMGVEVPKSVKFLTGFALTSDDGATAAVSKEMRVPLPEIDADVPVPATVAILVAKVTEFKGEKLLKLVNVAQLKDVDGRRYLETLTTAARESMSSAMKVEGRGIYGLYIATAPIAFVSGKVTLDGAPAGGSLVISTDGPFLAMTDDAGQYTIANLQGQAALSAYHLATGAHGDVALPIEAPGATNPKTGQPVETPATVKPLPGLDTLNLVGVDIALASSPAVTDAPNADFELGSLAHWTARGNASTLTEDIASVFPGTAEQHYAFVSSGEGALAGKVSGLTRDFDIPAAARTLKVEYNFVSQEYPSWVNSQYNDLFYILIGGNKAFLHRETVNNNAGSWKDFFKPLGNVTKSGAAHEGVLHVFGGETGQRTASFDVSPCAGQKTRLIFAVSDVGDSIYDTAALINRIWFE